MPVRYKAAIALSGGVDSAVAASLLRQQGWDLLGVHLRLTPWSLMTDWVRTLSRHLDIPLMVFDLQREFAQKVLDYFISEYTRGRTPNPCVRCNAAIKFGRLWELVQREACTHLATGHYAQLQPLAAGVTALHRGLDRCKDQSYFLSRLPLSLLPNLIFPLGGLTKETVRQLYADAGLPALANQRESMELCFIPSGDYQGYLQARRGGTGPPGDFIDTQGRVLGRHQGLECYTVGQRRGLGLPAREPYYVIEIQPETNRVVVGTRTELSASGLMATHLNWLIDPPATAFEAVAMIRYRHPGVQARITPRGPDEVQVDFATPQSAVAPGQAVVFYNGDRVLGSGWIEARLR